MAIKVHVEPHVLQRGRPAIMVVPDGHNPMPFCVGVVIRCECGQVAAEVRQIETAAHVIVGDLSHLEVVNAQEG